VRELPQLVQLHQQHQGDVLGITYNMDYIGTADEPPESFREDVLKILEPRKATTINVISTDADTVITEKLGFAAVPAVLVYDKKGELRKQFDNDDGEFGDEGFNYENHIVPLVKELLAEEG
jgi:hypothetical protein